MKKVLFIFLIALTGMQCAENKPESESTHTPAKIAEEQPALSHSPGGRWILTEMTAPDRPGDTAFQLLADIENGGIWNFDEGGLFSKKYKGEPTPEVGSWEFKEGQNILLVKTPALDGGTDEIQYQIRAITESRMKLVELKTNFHLSLHR
ncbi:MAG: hypothetical protein KDC34_08600 [Saprospiraceae bacterium]|nr:hypothetical protein [Saprospiraceae bacterium]